MGFPLGAQFVRQRLVPVGVQANAPRFIAAPPPIQIAPPQPQSLNSVGSLTSALDMNHQRLVNSGVPPQNNQGHVQTINKSSHNHEILSEEDFYKWQMQLKNRYHLNNYLFISKIIYTGSDEKLHYITCMNLHYIYLHRLLKRFLHRKLTFDML